jgi:hypothetical protein
MQYVGQALRWCPTGHKTACPTDRNVQIFIQAKVRLKLCSAVGNFGWLGQGTAENNFVTSGMYSIRAKNGITVTNT